MVCNAVKSRKSLVVANAQAFSYEPAKLATSAFCLLAKIRLMKWQIQYAMPEKILQ